MGVVRIARLHTTIDEHAKAYDADTRGIAPIKREQHRQRPDEMRSGCGHASLLALAAHDETKVTVFQIAQTAVNQTRRTTAGPAGEIRSIDERDAEISEGGPMRNRRTGN